MKTLIITSQYPLPEIGGNRMRSMNFVRYFKQFGSVDLAWYQDSNELPEGDHPFEKRTPLVLDKGPVKPLPLRERFGRLWPGKPWIVCSYSDNTVRQLHELIEKEEYDRIICRYAPSAWPLLFLSEQQQRRVIIDIDDIITPDLYASVHGRLPGIRGLRSWLDYHCYRRYQLACARVGTAIVCSEDDRILLSKRAPDAEIRVVPNTAPNLELPKLYQRDGYYNINTLLFVGNLGYRPNQDGLQWFIDKIFTIAADLIPGLKLVIAGKDPTPWLREICSQRKNLILKENPESIIPLYESCGAVIVPLLSGGGTRIKILEAGFARRPVLSTAIGAYGLGIKDRSTILLFEHAVSFMEQLVWLNNWHNYQSLTENMEQLVTERYSSTAFNLAMDRLFGARMLSVAEPAVPNLVSVIVPVYNRANLVRKTMDSILAQTWQHLEIIAVNDGSTDDSLAVLQEYAYLYPGKVRVITQPNSGQIKARNAGIREASGSFIAFLDSDDTWTPEKLALQLPLFRKGVGLVYCAINEVTPEGDVIKTVPCEPGMRGDIYKQLLICNRMTGGSVVVTRQALERVGLFDETLKAAENRDLWIRIAREFRVEYVERPMLNYLRHPGNLSANTELMAGAAHKILEKHIPQASRNRKELAVHREAHAMFHYSLGVHYFSAEKYLQAMGAFLRCWSHRPCYRDSSQRMLRCLLGSSINRWLSSVKSQYKLSVARGES